MWQWDLGAAAFIGPEDSCQVEATIAAAQNLPMISFVSLKTLTVAHFVSHFHIM